MRKYPYKEYTIVENNFDEYNVCKRVGDDDLMVGHTATFRTLFDAQKYIDNFVCDICKNTRVFDGQTCVCTGEVTHKGLY